jgi:cytochrome c oxidase subunit 2
VIILTWMFVSSVATGRAIADEQGRGEFPITITGQQWWWQVEYPAGDPSLVTATANEVHIPTGRRIHLQLRSVDVIHSFWVPSLAGKRDLIPGRDTELWFQADQPGVFRGQCAEYCGLQHAHMALEVVAQPPSEFNAWLDQQRQNARDPQSPEERRGQQVFQSQSCAFCHSLRGIDAFGASAPDLTHLASRRSLAAGTLPVSTETIADWIGNSQHFKPGTRMPPFALPHDQLQNLATYLGSLK